MTLQDPWTLQQQQQLLTKDGHTSNWNWDHAITPRLPDLDNNNNNNNNIRLERTEIASNLITFFQQRVLHSHKS